MRYKQMCLIIVLIFGFTSCTYQVNLVPNPAPRVPEKVDVDLGIFIDESEMMGTYTQQGLCLVGSANRWEFNVGNAMQRSAELAFKNAFTRVEMLESNAEFANNGLTLLATPRLLSFDVNQLIETSVSIECKLVDGNGKTLYENTVIGRGSDVSQTCLASMLGVFGGANAMRITGNSAFENAFEILVQDIVQAVDFSPYTQ